MLRNAHAIMASGSAADWKDAVTQALSMVQFLIHVDWAGGLWATEPESRLQRRLAAAERLYQRHLNQWKTA